jgi:hypothetical protein
VRSARPQNAPSETDGGDQLKRLALAAACLTLVLLEALLAPPAHAIPAWSRRYKEPKTDCLSCHTWGSWKLNKRGQDFMRYGHHFEGDKEEGLGLSEYFSFAFKFRFIGGNQKLESFHQEAISLYTGGTLGKGFSYFVEAYLHDNTGRNTGASDFGDFGRTKLAESVFQYTYGPESRYVTARIGQILPQLLHVNGMGARTSAARANLWTRATINAGNAYQPFSRQYGLDVAYHAFASNAVVGVVNGTGTLLNVDDNNQHKDLYFSLDHTFDKWGSQLGVLYYDGQFPVGEGATGYADRFHRWIGVGDFSRAQFNAKAAFVTGRDEVDATGRRSKGDGFYLEGYYHPVKWGGPFARYERFDPNKNVDGDHSDGVTGGLTCTPFEYGRFVGEVSRYGRAGAKETSYIFEINFMW